MVRAICMEPEPQESEPALESGTADAGEDAFGEGAASVTVRCGRGGSWTAAVVAAETTGTGVIWGAETALGLILVCGCGVGAGARPGR